MADPKLTRQERLAAKLRENLRRRKAQTRAMPAPAGDRSKGSAEGDDEAVASATSRALPLPGRG